MTHITTKTTPSTGRLILAVALLLTVFAPPSAVQSQDARESAGRRIVAIADIHGALDSFTSILRETGLIDADSHWSGGDALLVQTGDFTDRGPEVRACMDLLMRLQEEAPAQGGEVIVTLGNHEAMNLIGFLRDTTPDDPAAFVDDDSEDRRDEAYELWTEMRRRRADSLDQSEPQSTPEVRQAWDEAHPLGYVERMAAFGPDGRYGRWLRTLPTLVRIDDAIFMHAGLNPTYGDDSVDELNELISGDLQRFDDTKAEMVRADLITENAGLADMIEAADEKLIHVTATLEETGGRLRGDERRLVLALDWVLQYQSWHVLAGEGLLWFRGLALWPDDEYGEQVREMFEAQEIARMVVGHTRQIDGNIRSRFDNAVFLADTGMLVEVYAGRPSALEIQDGRFTAVYVGERRQLYPPAPEQAGSETLDVPISRISRRRPPQNALAPAVATRQWLGSDGTPLPFVDDEGVLEFLRRARVISMTDVGSGRTAPRRVELEDNGVRARAIFHDVDLTRERAEIGGRRFAVFRDNWRNQIAGYWLARELGLHNVPPTVQQTINGERGSLQLWLENDGIRTNGERTQAREFPPDLEAWLGQEWAMNVFDALVFNDDRNPGNVLVDGNWNLWMIDHTRAFQTVPSIRNPEKLAHMDRALWVALQELTRQRVAELLDPHLHPDQINAIMRRRDAIIEHIGRLVDELGEDEVFYDLAVLKRSAIGGRAA